jgi:hypothetical protein
MNNSDKKREAWRLRLSLIFKRAWKLFKNGFVSFSMSLKVSWNVNKGKISEATLKKTLLKGGMKY